MEEIENNMELPWNTEYMCENKFEHDRNNFIELEYRKYMAVYKISNWWLQLKYNPNSKVGKKFMLALYQENFDCEM